MAAVESNYNASEMLTEVNNAIYAVLVGGQSYNSADCSRGFNQFTG